MISGCISNGAGTCILVIGLNAKNRSDMATGSGVAFTADLAGTMAMVRTHQRVSLMVVHAETEEELQAVVKKEFDQANKKDNKFTVLHTDDIRPHPDTEIPEE